MPRKFITSPVRTAHWIIRSMFEIITRRGMQGTVVESESGITLSTIKRWGMGAAPSIANAEAVLNVVGYQLDIIPIGEPTYVQRQTANAAGQFRGDGDVRFHEAVRSQYVSDLGDRQVRVAQGNDRQW